MAEGFLKLGEEYTLQQASADEKIVVTLWHDRSVEARPLWRIDAVGRYYFESGPDGIHVQSYGETVEQCLDEFKENFARQVGQAG